MVVMLTGIVEEAGVLAVRALDDLFQRLVLPSVEQVVALLT